MKPVHIDVTVRDNETIERALKRFTRKVKKKGILEEVRERRYFVKPSDKKRRKKAKRIRDAKRLKK